MPDSHMPKITVLMPVFNAEKYLRGAVDSILAQSFQDFELMVIDDGSTDGSLTLLQTMAARDPRIRLSSRSNVGLVATLNEMARTARGEYLARMDPDDVAAPLRFEKQLRALEDDPLLDAVGSNVHFIDPAGRRLLTFEYPQSHQAIDAWTMAVDRGSAMSHPAMMIRATSLERIGGYRQDYWPAEDADLILRLAEGGRLLNLNETLLAYRLHSASIGSRLPVMQKDAHFRAVVDAALRRGLPVPIRDSSAAPCAEAETPARRDIKWAWWALSSGNLRGARALALRAVCKSPFERASWLVFACAMRGH